LIIDFTGDDLDENNCTEIRNKFEQSQSKPPFFISYISDMYNSIWTSDKPDPLIWKRTIKVAKIAYDQLLQVHFNMESPKLENVKWTFLFDTSLQDYDALIWLETACLTEAQTFGMNSKKGSTPPPHGRSKQAYCEIDVTTVNVDFNPIIDYVKELEARFSEYAIFFYDPYASVIGIIWKPAAFLLSKFKLKNCINTIPISDMKDDLIGTLPNIFSLLADIQSIGEGFVSKIHIANDSGKISKQ